MDFQIGLAALAGGFSALALPLIGGLVWLVRLEGSVRLNRQRLDHHSETHVSIQDDQKTLKESIHELDQELKELNQHLSFIRGHMQSETEHKGDR